MRRICTTFGLIGILLAALALPAGASASHLSRADFKSTSKYCKALRAEMGAKAFKRAFRAKRVRGAHRRCVKKKVTVRALAPVSIFPVPAPTDACTPAEPPLPVRAFAADPCAQPAPVVACGDDDDEDEEDRGGKDDEAEPESDAAACEDSAGDDDDEDDDERHSDDDDGDSDDDD